ncbi:hypothetical protein Q7P36_002207 [Cladosporium allicinum]
MSIKSATEYLVQAGDTFWSIGQKLSMSVGALEAANPGVSAESLHVGQILHLSAGGSSSERSHQYTVISGDTLWAIAQKFGVPVATLEAANPGIMATQLQPGQVIIVPAGGIQSNPSKEDGYINYSGRASAFPDPSQWASYADLWAQNSRLMKSHDSDSEISQIKSAIQIVSKESGVDERVILCIIVQESGGNVRIPTTRNPIRNPGLMQSHNGAEFNRADPMGSILQMIRDGTEGTKDGDGLEQCYERYGNYYSAFRAYNSGSVNADDLNDPIGATASYVRDVANRLMGHTWTGM